jgi:hypothetical protein
MTRRGSARGEGERATPGGRGGHRSAVTERPVFRRHGDHNGNCQGIRVPVHETMAVERLPEGQAVLCVNQRPRHVTVERFPDPVGEQRTSQTRGGSMRWTGCLPQRSSMRADAGSPSGTR